MMFRLTAFTDYEVDRRARWLRETPREWWSARVMHWTDIPLLAALVLALVLTAGCENAITPGDLETGQETPSLARVAMIAAVAAGDPAPLVGHAPWCLGYPFCHGGCWSGSDSTSTGGYQPIPIQAPMPPPIWLPGGGWQN